ncbi:MAG: hypothetical protein IJ329_01805 [Clostridia bacterium]|nr:hypothetical protein [Clostridia bacterium]
MASMAQQKAPKKYLHIKHCIKKMQNRAKWVGVLYVIAMVALTALACLQPITFEGGAIGVLAFWKPFTLLTDGGDFLTVLKENALEIGVAVLYSVMLLILLINLIGALCSMGWLFKKKASKLYGFNRNMYAMDDIEKAYTSSLKAVLCIYFVIAILVVNVRANLIWAGAILGVGVFFHFLCGLLAGNTSLFTVDGEIIEEKRQVGTFSVFVRNLIQIAATAGFVFFFVKSCGAIAAFVQVLLQGGLGEMLSDPVSFAEPAVRLVLLVLGLIMICYAFGTTEFEPSGRETRGRRTFLWVSFIAFLVSLGAALFYALYYKVSLDSSLMILAGIALVAFVFEICLRKFPKTKEKNPDDVDANAYLEKGVTEEEELSENVALQPQILPPVYIPMPPFGQNYHG